MATTLRIGFAMGGGVSLGTFCGCALSQALKLLVLYGRDRNGQPYDKVVVDVFSGASAGALSLAAMLRYLLYQTDEQRKAAVSRLEKEFGADLDELGKAAREDLIAAQVVQDLQEELWSREIKLEKLLAHGDDMRLRFKASLLDRGAVDDIARRHLVEWQGSGIRFDRRRLLANRVLFACTLANLTPMVSDARAEFPGREVGFIGLNDGLRSHTHRDIRVFDLNFIKESDPKDERFPDRWCLFHDGPAKHGLIDDLNKPEMWARIAATAVASGGFPLAFEPVVLNRKAFEYGPKLWCPSFGRAIPNKKTDFDGQEPHLFSFVDGGTFNNEPIREAFRLASFMDGYTRAEEPDTEIERLIIFVDPFVSEPLPSFRVPILRRWLLEEPNVFGSLDGYDLRRAASLDRVLPHLATMIGALNNEGRTNEADKVFQVRRRFELRDGIRASLDATLGDGATHDEFSTLIDFCQERLDASDSDEVIPAGPLSLPGELERVIHEQVETRKATGKGNDFLPLSGLAESFLDAKKWEKDASAHLWLRLLSFVAVDLILGLEGKLAHAQLVAIAPFKDLEETQKNGTTIVHARPIDLPGGRLSGFAGFMSDEPDHLDYRAARYCAEEFLSKCGRIQKNTPPPDVSGLELSPEEQRRFENDVQKGLDDLAKRVAAMVKQSHLIKVFPLLDSMVSSLIAHFIRSKVAGLDWKGKREVSAELRVVVPNERFELDGVGTGDQDCGPVEDSPGGPWTLITIADYNLDKHEWTGGFVKEGKLDVDEDGTAFSRDKDFCEIELPTEEQLREATFSPNATFVITLTQKDRGKTVPDTRWKLEPGTSSLEDELLA